MGLLAACLPPLGPIIRRLPSPRKLYASVRHGLVSHSYPSGRSEPLERLSSTERMVNGKLVDGNKREFVAKRGEVSGDEEVEMV